jgi:hypothetical protein
VPTAKATSSLVNWQPFKAIDLSGAYQEDSTVAGPDLGNCA